jgi:hypothetical protein
MSKTIFCGIPVSGDLYGTGYERPAPLTELLRPLLSNPDMVSFGWIQGVPAFNDGEPCEFSAHTVWVQTSNDVDPEDPDDFDPYSLHATDSHPTMGTRGPWDSHTNTWRRKFGLFPELNELAQALRAAIESGSADYVLRGAFGDNSQVRVTRDGIVVSEYDNY